MQICEKALCFAVVLMTVNGLLFSFKKSLFSGPYIYNTKVRELK